jgi:hypothetical protein
VTTRALPILVWVDMDDEDEDWQDLIKSMLEDPEALLFFDMLTDLCQWHSYEAEILPMQIKER